MKSLIKTTTQLIVCGALITGLASSGIVKEENYTATLLVDQSPKEAFNAIINPRVINPRAWWSQSIEGSTDKLDSVFTYHFKDVHICKLKLIEFVPGKKVVWLVMDNYFSFIKDKSEWKGTKLSFEIAKKGNKTEIRFTHIGLVPEYECYNTCKDGWGNYINNSLYNLITTGKGKPNPIEGGYNEQLLRQHENQQKEKN
jgi:hypothetical protein